MSRYFIGKEAIEDLGEEIICVYIHIKYRKKKAIQYMKFLNFRYDLLIKFEGMLFFYQHEKYMPKCEVDDGFYKILEGSDIWESCPVVPDYRYRVISDGVICISYLPI